MFSEAAELVQFNGTLGRARSTHQNGERSIRVLNVHNPKAAGHVSGTAMMRRAVHVRCLSTSHEATEVSAKRALEGRQFQRGLHVAGPAHDVKVDVVAVSETLALVRWRTGVGLRN